jgi:phage tail sheath gpL-like
MSFVKILASVPDSATTMNSQYFQLNTSANQVDVQGLQKFLGDIVDGAQKAYLKVSTGAVQATGTVTFSSFVEDDTVTINGVVFTGKASPSGANQWAIGASDTECATNFAAKINASALAGITSVVTATSADAIVTLTAVQPGLTGNAVTLAISAHGSVSAARMAGGTDGTQVAVNFGTPS